MNRWNTGRRAKSDAGIEWVWGLFSPDGAEVLGGCGLYPRVGPRAVEIGYWLAAGQTGRGLATRAAAALTGVAFASPTIEQVEIRCERRNAASARIPERLGYTLVDSASVGAPAELMVWRITRGDMFRACPPDSAPPTTTSTSRSS